MAGDETPLDRVEIPVGGGFWRRLGRHGALVVGYALIGVHLAVFAVTAHHLAGPSLERHRQGEQLLVLLQISTVLLPLLAMCFLIVGELVRRGEWGGPSGHKPEALLPQGSTTVRLALLTVRWNVVWVLVSGAVAGVLLWLAVADQQRSLFFGDLEIMLMVNGIIAAGAFGATLGTLVKKLAWLCTRDRAARRDAAPLHPALARRQGEPLATRFWRSFSYRWRFDVWLCGIGAVALWLAACFAGGSVQDPAIPVFAVVGAVLLAGGVWATTQFWRSGEDLASAESVA